MYDCAADALALHQPAWSSSSSFSFITTSCSPPFPPSLLMGKGSSTSPTTMAHLNKLDHHQVEAMNAMGNFLACDCKPKGVNLQQCECPHQSNPMASTHNSTSLINDDFLIEDLSEFSNEDIAAPIVSTDSLSPPQQQSDDNNSANSSLKSNCTASNRSSAASAMLRDAAVLDYRSPLHGHDVQDTSLSLPCQDEICFEWLSSLGDDNLVYSGPHFSMDSFLLAEPGGPFGDDYVGMMKQTSFNEEAKDANVGHISASAGANSTHEHDQDIGAEDTMWDDGLKSTCNTAIFAPPTGSRSARSKRARSSGWSSTSSILCSNLTESASSTTSLNSTSRMMMPTAPQYGSNPASFLYCKPDEVSHKRHPNPESSVLSPRAMSDPGGDKPLCNLLSKHQGKLGSDEQLLWRKEELDNHSPREESVGNYGGGGGLQTRRCSHCQSQKTPQWRAGPEGPKTLCNACGVRYKSGRLFDEYRPAKSPTFLSYKHSNSHKKVMEMRRRKAFQYGLVHQQQHPQPHHHGVPPPLPKHATSDIVNQHLISKLKVKLHVPATSEPGSATHSFSDVTLIRTRNAIDSPSSFLY